MYQVLQSRGVICLIRWDRPNTTTALKNYHFLLLDKRTLFSGLTTFFALSKGLSKLHIIFIYDPLSFSIDRPELEESK